MTVKQAHVILGINYSTAKMIMRKYKLNGKITKFKKEQIADTPKTSFIEPSDQNSFLQTQNINQSQ
jgi:hypothetical protein